MGLILGEKQHMRTADRFFRGLSQNLLLSPDINRGRRFGVVGFAARLLRHRCETPLSFAVSDWSVSQTS
jgi:hypothetical protein